MKLKSKVAQRVAVTAVVVVSLVFFSIAIVKAWDATNGELPSVARLAIAGALITTGLLAAAYAWGVLLGGRRVDHGAALLVSQLGKYVPGGVWQLTGQIGLARSSGVRMQRGATAFTTMALTQALAGSAYTVLLAFAWSDLSVGLRVLLALAALATLALLDRRWMVWALHKVPRTRGASDELVPRQSAIVRAWVASIVTLSAIGIAYWVLLSSIKHVDQPLLVVAAYATAWTVGFIAVPIPSGLGIREAVLVGILHGSFPSSVVVAASVYHRLVSIGVEGVMAGVASHRVRPRRATAEGASLGDTADAIETHSVPPNESFPEGS